jgi:ABC-2 type transport system permease protein
MARYLRLLSTSMRYSLLLALQYRGDFLIDAGLTVLRSMTALVPILVVFHDRNEFSGWTFHDALLVTCWFTLLRGVIEGAVRPTLSAVIDHIRTGTLDFVLLKPADAQFLVSTNRFEVSPVGRVITAVAIFVYAFVKMGRVPSVTGIGGALVLLAASTVLLYSLWILTVSAAFYVVRIDNLIYLFDSIFDAARWPVTVYRGFVWVLFTFILPVALMTTYPAESMLDRLSPVVLVASIGGALAFAVCARLVWLRSIGKYTSASS